MEKIEQLESEIRHLCKSVDHLNEIVKKQQENLNVVFRFYSKMGDAIVAEILSNTEDDFNVEQLLKIKGE